MTFRSMERLALGTWYTPGAGSLDPLTTKGRHANHDQAEADGIFICIESFAGNEFAVAEGDLLSGDDERVQRCPDRFVVVGTPEEEIRRLKIAAAVPPPPPEPLGRVKLRVLPGQGGLSALDGGRPQTVFANGREYSSGETLEAEGANAEHLIDVGACEVVRPLRRKKEAPGG